MRSAGLIFAASHERESSGPKAKSEIEALKKTNEDLEELVEAYKQEIQEKINEVAEIKVEFAHKNAEVLIKPIFFS